MFVLLPLELKVEKLKIQCCVYDVYVWCLFSTNHVVERTVKRFDVPERLILKEDGDVIYDQSLPKVGLIFP